ncbi:MAG: hypothetical protein DRJ42_19060 [Deltaproteobacteria bacterium]|nr:MAG: hypothetical protein DRJ42_19060 [Deltaproteobacteria bacterium]
MRIIAGAALRLLAQETGIDFTGRASRNPPSWARSSRPERPQHRDRDRNRDRNQDRDQDRNQDRGPADSQARGRTDQDGVDLFLPVGKAGGIRPGDIVGALTNDLGVNREQIGRITILPHKTFLRVDSDLASRVLEGRAEIRLRGRGVPVTKAHSGEQPDRGPGPQKRPFAQGGKKPPMRKDGPARRFRPKNR